MRHILTGYDHVLFLLCLLLPSVMRRTPRAGSRSSAFAGVVADLRHRHGVHRGALDHARLGGAEVFSLPPAFIEPAIAVTIVLAALDNICPIFPARRGRHVLLRPDPRLRLRRRAGRTQPADGRVRLGAAQFNLGLELGQLLIVAARRACCSCGAAGYRRGAIRGGSSRRSDRRAVAYRAHGGCLAFAVLRPPYNAANSTPQERERHPVMTPRTTTARPAGCSPPRLGASATSFLSRQKSAARPALFFLEFFS